MIRYFKKNKTEEGCTGCDYFSALCVLNCPVPDGYNLKEYIPVETTDFKVGDYVTFVEGNRYPWGEINPEKTYGRIKEIFNYHIKIRMLNNNSVFPLKYLWEFRDFEYHTIRVLEPKIS